MVLVKHEALGPLAGVDEGEEVVGDGEGPHGRPDPLHPVVYLPLRRQVLRQSGRSSASASAQGGR